MCAILLVPALRLLLPVLLNGALGKGLVGLAAAAAAEAEEVGRLLALSLVLELEAERLRPNVLALEAAAFEVVGRGLGGGGLNVVERG